MRHVTAFVSFTVLAADVTLATAFGFAAGVVSGGVGVEHAKRTADEPTIAQSSFFDMGWCRHEMVRCRGPVKGLVGVVLPSCRSLLVTTAAR